MRIEAAAETAYVVTFDGIRVHEAEPQEVIEAIRKHGEVDTEHREYPTNLWFPDLGINLYREHSDEDKFDTIGISLPKSKE